MSKNILRGWAEMARQKFQRGFISPTPTTDGATPEPPKKAAPSGGGSYDDILSMIDPLDPMSQLRGGNQNWKTEAQAISPFRTIKDFMMDETDTEDNGKPKRTVLAKAMDSLHGVKIGDAGPQTPVGTGILDAGNPYTVSPALFAWYMSQSFIGYQACAIIAQHWLVDKACSQAGIDACRNGWKIKAKNETDLSQADNDRLCALDIEYDLKNNLVEYYRFKNVFGIRVMLFEVESEDPDYYSKPFNIDGVTEGSYKGISQVDPYWMTPMLTSESTSDPSARHFYDPDYWIISGKKYHRTHLRITRGPEPADILKPTYIFGGIPLAQRIYERVYAAERTANEAPLLSLNKRTTAIHVDMEKVLLQQAKFEERLMMWIRYRDNHAIKVLGKEETMEQFDTALADFDSVIMNQYQLVAAICETPATKLLGTSPKGFNATGEFEMKSYHEKLESVQEHDFTPVLDRHYMLLAKSQGIQAEIVVLWEDVDSPTAQEQADLNAKRAETDERYTNMGVISPDEVRNKLRDDDKSGYNRLEDADANVEPGMTPENLAALEKAGAESEKSEAAQTTAGAHETTASANVVKAEGETGKTVPEAQPSAGAAEEAGAPTGLPAAEPGINAPKGGDPETREMLAALEQRLDRLVDMLMPEGDNIDAHEASSARTTVGSTARSTHPTVAGIQNVIGHDVDPSRLPKLKIHGMVCAIENPKDTIRKGRNLDGQTWSAKMVAHYGFIKGIMGADQNELDCFVGSNYGADNVFVINQNDPNTSEFDEHKVMLGFNDAESAKQAYLDSFSKGWFGFDSIIPMTVDQFKSWTKTGNLNEPATNPLEATELAASGAAGSDPHMADE